MHRFQPGNENPILNDKLLREAYQKGRQQALYEQGLPPSMTTGPNYPNYNTSATEFPNTYRTDMGGGGGGGNRNDGAVEVDNSPIPDVNVWQVLEDAAAGMSIPNWIIEWFAQNASWLSEALKIAMAMGRRSVNMGGR